MDDGEFIEHSRQLRERVREALEHRRALLALLKQVQADVDQPAEKQDQGLEQSTQRQP